MNRPMKNAYRVQRHFTIPEVLAAIESHQRAAHNGTRDIGCPACLNLHKEKIAVERKAIQSARRLRERGRR